MLTQERIDEIKARDAAATPGPWQWRYYGGKEDPQLTAPHSGLLCIMDFVRRGMHGAEPRFAERTKNDRGGIMRSFSEWWKRDMNHALLPDASFIAHSRQDVTDLLAEVERLQGVVSTQQKAIEDIRSN
ncbi:MAG TPA: hypothetical protein VN519_06640 [Bryobacteraceae bacterium]|nr:hypothetical protein [Bryobacteraceae bacterium]